jgi:GNAT superfamily N-acetyltransferase
MNYTIRKAKESDLAEIILLCKEHATYERADYERLGKAEKLYNMLFCENPHLHCLIVECNTEIVGYAAFSKECSTWNAAYYVYMDCLFIREKFRGFGIGAALVEEIVEFSKRVNAHHIEWQTPVFNERAIKFYNRIGATGKEKMRFTLTYS